MDRFICFINSAVFNLLEANTTQFSGNEIILMSII